jgi:hypothetical protein
MLTLAEKDAFWRKASRDFPLDSMLRELHFIRELMEALRERSKEPKSYRDLGVLARDEYLEWLKSHPEIQSH